MLGILLWNVEHSLYSGYTPFTNDLEVRELGYLVAHVLRNIIELGHFPKRSDAFPYID